MNRLRWLTACAAILSAAPAPGQFPVAPDVNLFGDDLPQKYPNGTATTCRRSGRAPSFSISTKPKLKPPPPAPKCSSLAMTGSCTGNWWKSPMMKSSGGGRTRARPCTSRAPLVRRIALVPVSPEGQNIFPGGMLTVASTTGSAQPSAKSTPATLTLPGGDWLFGEATTTDGESFALRLEDGTSVPLHRAQLEWLHFSPEPAPALGFFGSKLDFEGWLAEPSNMEIAGEDGHHEGPGLDRACRLTAEAFRGGVGNTLGDRGWHPPVVATLWTASELLHHGNGGDPIWEKTNHAPALRQPVRPANRGPCHRKPRRKRVRPATGFSTTASPGASSSSATAGRSETGSSIPKKRAGTSNRS